MMRSDVADRGEEEEAVAAVGEERAPDATPLSPRLVAGSRRDSPPVESEERRQAISCRRIRSGIGTWPLHSRAVARVSPRIPALMGVVER